VSTTRPRHSRRRDPTPPHREERFALAIASAPASFLDQQTASQHARPPRFGSF
jgi:hypothetical protein